MKTAVCFLVLFVCVSAQSSNPKGGAGFIPIPLFPFPFAFPGSEETAASLGGAKVGLYGKSQGGNGGFGGFPGGFGGLRSKDVSAASLENTKVGVYGKERY